ncbi:hypothetical protein K438DRAFT_1971592 [Mycena galopus ATCC 62051]|nr:hypothetical protein K438DRAFT_1971592 [Mycena galopus ATCC 62051]
MTARPNSSTTNIEERNALQFIHTLELKDLLAKTTEERVENWAPSNKLAKAIRKFIWALLLLPNIHFYSGTVENAVIKALRDSNVKEMPASGSFDCDTLTKFVARKFSIARYSMKKTITSSTEKGADTGYIAALAAELLTHAPTVNATLGLYFRLAFIRAHTKANHTANEFWTKVDDQLEELHSETPQEFVAALELIYDDDIELYVAPVGSAFKTGDPVGDTSPQWLQNLSAAAIQVRRIKKQGTK